MMGRYSEELPSHFLEMKTYVQCNIQVQKLDPRYEINKHISTLHIYSRCSSSPARAGRVKPKTFKIGSDCFFAKSTAFRR
jgi:hypothetical protein